MSEFKVREIEVREIEVREVKNGRGKICEDLLRSLHLWFGIESAILQYAKDVETMTTFVAFLGDKPIGILSLNPHSE